MINIDSESVHNIIDHVRQFQTEASMDAEEEPESLNDDQAFERLTEWHGDPVYSELRSLIDALEPNQQHMLVALMWLGRGDYSVDEWQESLAYASEADSVSTADYLIATPLLADYLEEGLSQLGYDED